MEDSWDGRMVDRGEDGWDGRMDAHCSLHRGEDGWDGRMDAPLLITQREGGWDEWFLSTKEYFSIGENFLPGGVVRE